MYIPVQPRTADAARMLCRSLDAFFRSECSDAFGVTVSIADIDVNEPAGEEAAKEVPCTIALETRGDREPRAHFVARHVGGNVYDVRGGLDDGLTETFTCCLPDVSGIPLAPSVGRSVGTFLVRELQRLAGSQDVQSEAPSSDERSDDATSSRTAERGRSPRREPNRREHDRTVSPRSG